MARTKYSHIHKYKKILWGKSETPVWRCMLDNCPHYLHAGHIEGKRSICWKCGRPFIIDRTILNRVRPKCSSCIDHTQGAKKEEDDSILPAAEFDAMLNDLLKGL